MTLSGFICYCVSGEAEIIQYMTSSNTSRLMKLPMLLPSPFPVVFCFCYDQTSLRFTASVSSEDADWSSQDGYARFLWNLKSQIVAF